MPGDGLSKTSLLVGILSRHTRMPTLSVVRRIQIDDLVDSHWKARMPRKIDSRPGREFGLVGSYADMPAFQIVNLTHEKFLLLTSRLIGLEYGKRSHLARGHPVWSEIDAERSRLADRLSKVGADPVAAAVLSQDIDRLEKTVIGLAIQVETQGSAP